MSKFIGSFQPVTDVIKADQYYTERHVPFVRQLFLESQPAILRYVPQRAIASYRDGLPGPPSGWRWVVTERAPGSEYILSDADQEHIWNDHVQFMRDLRSFYVKATAILDRGGRLGEGAKCLIEYDAPGVSAELGRSRYLEHLELLTAIARETEGLTLLISNEVRRELATAPLREPRQRLSGGSLEQTDRVAVGELWFTDRASADRFFARKELKDALAPTRTWRATSHVIIEEVAVDRLASDTS